MAKSATFGVKWASDESFCPSTVISLGCNGATTDIVFHKYSHQSKPIYDLTPIPRGSCRRRKTQNFITLSYNSFTESSLTSPNLRPRPRHLANSTTTIENRGTKPRLGFFCTDLGSSTDNICGSRKSIVVIEETGGDGFGVWRAIIGRI